MVLHRPRVLHWTSTTLATLNGFESSPQSATNFLGFAITGFADGCSFLVPQLRRIESDHASVFPDDLPCLVRSLNCADGWLGLMRRTGYIAAELLVRHGSLAADLAFCDGYRIRLYIVT